MVIQFDNQAIFICESGCIFSSAMNFRGLEYQMLDKNE